jgi:16S rRNA (cytosine1402-N4)-methyltransferase
VSATEFRHAPVLLEEALAALKISSEGWYLDATFGRGGHSGQVLQALGASGRLLAIDRDPTAIALGRERYAGESRLQLVQCAFANLAQALHEVGMSQGLDGALFDLGVSSPQLDDAARGFSFMHDGPLDMRMDNSTGVTAASWLAKVSEHELLRVISEYGEERFAKRIATAIVQARSQQPINTTAELAKLVSDSVPTREPGKHPATRTFQAIRIAVNEELQQIDQALQQVLTQLKPGGRLCVISFHSLEDQRVKKFMQQHSQDDPMFAGLPLVPPERRARLKRIGKAIHASEAEVKRNPRARSAILRVAEKVAA